jgi:pectin methylesterase-like acyl-CoA thioesterase
MNKWGKVGIVLGLIALGLTAQAGEIWYVDDSNTGAEDGSMEHPFDTIQEAVAAAADEDSIQVAAGTYAGEVVVDGKDLYLWGTFTDNDR